MCISIFLQTNLGSAGAALTIGAGMERVRAAVRGRRVRPAACGGRAPRAARCAPSATRAVLRSTTESEHCSPLLHEHLHLQHQPPETFILLKYLIQN